MTDKLPMSDSHFKVMAFIHGSPLRRIFDNPIKTLKAAGIQPGQQVLEVGCGPGFFTIPAAKLVGGNGCIHAIDLHPLAIKMVEKKLQKNSLTNVKVTIANAAKTGLPSNSIDLVLLFGVIHTLPLEQESERSPGSADLSRLVTRRCDQEWALHLRWKRGQALQVQQREERCEWA
jgi:ribosomal protein L11 methylase PrmA